MADNNERNQINALLNALKPHPRNNEFFSDIEGEEYKQLKNSIAEMGIITPILVSADMTIISGHQRYRAAQELGLKNVPIIIDQSIDSESDKVSKLIDSNFQRTTNDPIKKAKWIVEYEELRGVRQGSAYKKAEPNNSAQVTQKDIATELGISADTLQNMKKLLRLIPQFQGAISDGRITPTVGYKVLAQLSGDEQKQLYEHLPSNGKLSQKKIECFIGEMRKCQNIENSTEDVDDSCAVIEKDIVNTDVQNQKCINEFLKNVENELFSLRQLFNPAISKQEKADACYLLTKIACSAERNAFHLYEVLNVNGLGITKDQFEQLNNYIQNIKEYASKTEAVLKEMRNRYIIAAFVSENEK